MTHHLAGAALLPLWLLSAGGWAAFVTAHWLTGGVSCGNPTKRIQQ